MQLTSQIHGAVVDQLTEDHIRSVLVLLPDTAKLNEIDSIMKKAVVIKSEAVKSTEESIRSLTARFGESAW